MLCQPCDTCDGDVGVLSIIYIFICVFVGIIGFFIKLGVIDGVDWVFVGWVRRCWDCLLRIFLLFYVIYVYLYV